eukprot:gene12072-biopygen15465
MRLPTVGPSATQFRNFSCFLTGGACGAAFSSFSRASGIQGMPCGHPGPARLSFPPGLDRHKYRGRHPLPARPDARRGPRGRSRTTGGGGPGPGRSGRAGPGRQACLAGPVGPIHPNPDTLRTPHIPHQGSRTCATNHHVMIFAKNQHTFPAGAPPVARDVCGFFSRGRR